MSRLNILLFCVVLGLAMWIVKTRHDARFIYSQIEKLRHQEDELNAEYERLKLEQSTWGAHNLVDKVATQRLGMRLPEKKDTIVLNIKTASDE